jgi:hypothetical protein
MKSSTATDRATAPEKKGSWHNPQYAGWPIHKSVPSLSTKTAIEAVGVKQPSVDGRLLGLLGPYLRHAIGTFNTCSRGTTHRSLTDTCGGYNLGGADFPHLSPRPSQLMVLHFPPKGSARSQVIQSQHSLKWNGVKHLLPTRGLSTVVGAHKISISYANMSSKCIK